MNHENYEKKFKKLVGLALIDLCQNPGLIKYDTFKELKNQCDKITDSEITTFIKTCKDN